MDWARQFQAWLADQPCSKLLDGFVLANWLGLIASCVAAVAIPEVRNWHRYGKLRQDESTVKATIFDRIVVPKNWFAIFYLEAFVWSIFLALDRGRLLENGLASVCKVERGFLGSFPTILIGLMIFQSARRLVEEYLTPTSKATMHIGGFMVGAMFYLLIPLALVRTPAREFRRPVDMVNDMIGLVLFTFGTYHQTRCHSILRELKRRGGYAIPKGDLFEASSNPHYFAEILIYSGLLAIASGRGHPPVDLYLGLLFTIVNLTITARRTHQWYLDKFKGEYDARRAVIVPFIY